MSQTVCDIFLRKANLIPGKANSIYIKYFGCNVKINFLN